MHDRETVVRLQQAHADHIEAVYRQTMMLPGNPDGIEILNIGETRVFLSNHNRLENRAVFTGNETLEELREVTAVFERKGVDGFFEINPANFYRSKPFSWKSEMLPALIELGYHPSDFRCVWYLEQPVELEGIEGMEKIRPFSSDEVEDYIEAMLVVEPVEQERLEGVLTRLRYEFTPSWTNFIGYEGNEPVSLSRLFVKDGVGYLAWGFTAEAHRRKGHHQLHVLARTRKAFELGCDVVFSVTDFNIPSSLSLQKVGFILAYNYLLFVRWPAR